MKPDVRKIIFLHGDGSCIFYNTFIYRNGCKTTAEKNNTDKLCMFWIRLLFDESLNPQPTSC